VRKVAQVLKATQKTSKTGADMEKMKKIVFIYARLVENPEAYQDKTNTDIEKEILHDIGPIPYVAQIEKITVLDSPDC
jgi:hypothetical protein